MEDHFDQNDGNEFVPRFVKVFNESKMREPRLPELTSAQSVDLYQKRMTYFLLSLHRTKVQLYIINYDYKRQVIVIIAQN